MSERRGIDSKIVFAVVMICIALARSIDLAIASASSFSVLSNGSIDEYCVYSS